MLLDCLFKFRGFVVLLLSVVVDLLVQLFGFVVFGLLLFVDYC